MIIEFTSAVFEKMVVHRIGNRNQDESCYLSTDIQQVDDREKQFFLKFFLNRFTRDVFYNLSTTGEVYGLVSKIFKDNDNFVGYAAKLGARLYNVFTHPMMKSCEMYIVYLQDVIIEDEMTDAIGIFRAEEKDYFVEVPETGEVKASLRKGKAYDSLEKGCLIFNTSQKDGFRCCIIDDSMKKKNSVQFWAEDFLEATPSYDDYSVTKGAMTFISKFAEDTEMESLEAIALMNKAKDFFTEHTYFDKQTFEKEVLGADQDLIDAFEQTAMMQGSRVFDSNFEISPTAVKEEKKNFKSVLKLDRNFHIYIHGNRQFIEQGYDEEKNMKYYKVYFEREKLD